MTHDDGDPHLTVARQQIDSRVAKHLLESAFGFLIMNAAGSDFTRLFDAIDELKRADIRLYQSLMGQTIVRSIFNMVESEDTYRCRQPLEKRGGSSW